MPIATMHVNETTYTFDGERYGIIPDNPFVPLGTTNSWDVLPMRGATTNRTLAQRIIGEAIVRDLEDLWLLLAMPVSQII